MKLVGSHDANVTALLSAHQAIGVPQPVKLFGNEEQRRRFLPRCARGAISAFALTEPALGSDPARLSTTAELAPDLGRDVLHGRHRWLEEGIMPLGYEAEDLAPPSVKEAMERLEGRAAGA